jgi:hypothetical protein
MSSEMDVMGMDERQRLAWLRANRVTLIVVGITWLGMIAREWARGTFPVFLVVMVPVFALIRFASYRFFVRT